MIRINLLPVRQTQKRQTIQQQLLAGAAMVVVTIIVCIVWAASVSSTYEAKLRLQKTKQDELAQLQKIIGEVNEFNATKKELQEKLKIIDDLRKSKSGPVRAMDDLASEIPNRVWVTDFQENSGAVTITGEAIDHEDVSAFMKALQKSKYFNGVQLGFSKASQERRGVTLYKFQITCSVNYSA
ncbi:MAG: PilN domain-containing protein [Myxococcota bacterium]